MLLFESVWKREKEKEKGEKERQKDSQTDNKNQEIRKNKLKEHLHHSIMTHLRAKTQMQRIEIKNYERTRNLKPNGYQIEIVLVYKIKFTSLIRLYVGLVNHSI